MAQMTPAYWFTLTLITYASLFWLTPRLGDSPWIDVAWCGVILLTAVFTFLSFRSILAPMDKEKK